MLAELRALLTSVDAPAAPKSVYQEAIQVANCLAKRSIKTRSLTYHHLVDFYTLDPHCLLFRALRFFWQRDPDGRPLLAALCGYARDPVFRASAPCVLASPEGGTVSRQALEAFIEDQEAGCFSSATLKSTAQNINASLTQAGHLSGRARKIRAGAQPTPGSIAFRLLLGYLGDWINRQKRNIASSVDGAQEKLAAAEMLQKRLELILHGEKPYDVFVRWKPLAEQAIGWHPDLNDGVRMNIRPFLSVPDVGKRDAGVLRDKPNIKWEKDRGKDVESAPWYELGLQYDGKPGDRINDHHLTLDEKRKARQSP